MSKFLILNPDEIAKSHRDRAREIFDIWGVRDDSDWDDLIQMVAEALQITENKALDIEPYNPTDQAEDDLPEVIVTMSSVS